MIYEVKLIEKAKKDIKKLYKRYKKVKLDLLEVIDELEKNPFIGIHLTNSVYKIRMKNSSINKGKSGGFRVIYYVIIDDKEVLILKVFSKSDLENITNEEIINILKEID